MKKCPKCGKELNDIARFCGGCGARLAEQASAPAQGQVCPKCGNVLKPGARFCGKCGTKLETQAQAQANTSVPVSGNPSVSGTDAAKKDFSLIGSFLHWNILPSQIAVKIDENDIAAFGKCVKGVNIQEGIMALFLVGGKLVATLDAGSYPFSNYGVAEATEETPKGIVRSFVEGFGNLFKRGWNAITGRAEQQRVEEREAQQRAENAGLTMRIPESIPSVSFILVRTSEFHLVFSFKDANTANIRSDVGLDLLCKINDINAFYANMLLDKKMVLCEDVRNALAPLFENDLNLVLNSVSPEAVSNNAALQGQVLARLQSLMPGVYPFISIRSILKLTANQQDLDNLRSMSEELYVSEQELNQAMRRNEFMDRMQAEQNRREVLEMRNANAHRNEVQGIRNAQELAEMNAANAHRNDVQGIRNAQELAEMNAANAQHNAIADAQSSQGIRDLRRTTSTDLTQSQITAQFEADKEKVYEQMAMTQDERAKFDTMLKAQRQLREAKTEEEVAAAMHTYEQSGLLRKREMDNLRRQIAQDARLKDLNDAQLLAVTTMNNQHELVQQQMEWDMLMGRKRLQNEQDTQRMKEDFSMERQEKQDDFEIARQRKQDDFLDARRDKEEAHSDARRDKDEAHSDRRREADAQFSDSRRDSDAQFSDSRRDSDAQFSDGRRRSQIDLNAEERRSNINLNADERRSNIDLDKQEQMNRLDAMSRLEEMRRAREEAEHKRDMEMAAAVRNGNLEEKRLDIDQEKMRLEAQALREKQQLDAQALREKQQLDGKVNLVQSFKGMTFEEIMAANPNLTEHAARALEAKFNNTAALEAEKAKAEAERIIREKTEDEQARITAFMQQQMQQQRQDLDVSDQRRREDMASMQNMMMQMFQGITQKNQAQDDRNAQQTLMQLQMMRDMGVAQAGGAQSFQQQLLDAKQQELNHARADAAANSDRFVHGMETTINAVGRMNPTQFIPVQPAYAQPQKAQRKYAEAAPSAPVCPHCGAPLEPGAGFCEACGEKLT